MVEPSSPADSSSDSSPSAHSRAIALSDDGFRSEASLSSRGTPARHAVNLPRTASTSTGGCWTCRIRRKKCDEQRQGDSCATCIRLDIQCLGWGAKRPDWLRDKQAQEAFKAEIRNRLMSTGRIRGVPRQRRTPPLGFGGMPAPAEYDALGLGTGGPDAFRPRYPALGLPMHPHFEPGLVSPYDQSPQLSPYPGAFMEPGSAHPYGPHSAPLSAVDFVPPMQAPGLDAFYPPGPEPVAQPRLVQYYVEHVRRTQFPMATDAMDQTLQAVTVQDPQGAPAFALCALAALHYSRVQSAHGGADAEFGDSKAHHDRAWLLVASSGGHYSALDALAAAHLVLYALMSGGLTDWAQPLEVACEWLTATSLMMDENPRASLLAMPPPARLAAKLALWLDVVSSVSIAQPPRFLALLRRLGGATPDGSGNGGATAPVLWARAPGEPAPESSVESVSGAPDVLALALAETAALSYWKGQELRRGALSVRELVRRADTIENALRRALGPAALSRRPSLDPAAEPAADGLGPDVRRASVDVLKETAVLYIATVVSGHSPAVPEITASVQAVTRAVQALPAGPADRALLLPLFLAGCLADEARAREFFAGRLQAQLAPHGAALALTSVMSGMWRQRDTHGASGDWRRIARDLRLNILLL